MFDWRLAPAYFPSSYCLHSTRQCLISTCDTRRGPHQMPASTNDLPPLPGDTADARVAIVTKLDGTHVQQKPCDHQHLEPMQSLKCGFLCQPTKTRKVEQCDRSARDEVHHQEPPAIPDCLRLPPTAEAAALHQKHQLLHALTPDAPAVADVLANPTILAGCAQLSMCTRSTTCCRLRL